MDFGRAARIHTAQSSGLRWRMAGRTTGEMVVPAACLHGLRPQVADEAVSPKRLDGGIGLGLQIEGGQAGNSAGTLAVLDGGCAQAGSQVRLSAKGIADIRDRTCVGGLDAGGGALDVIIETG